LYPATAPTSKKTPFFSRNADKSPAIDHGMCCTVMFNAARFNKHYKNLLPAFTLCFKKRPKFDWL